MTPC